MTTKRRLDVIVEDAGTNLSAYIENVPIITVGNNMDEIKKNIREAIDLYLEGCSDPCELLIGEFELVFKTVK